MDKSNQNPESENVELCLLLESKDREIARLKAGIAEILEKLKTLEKRLSDDA